MKFLVQTWSNALSQKRHDRRFIGPGEQSQTAASAAANDCRRRREQIPLCPLLRAWEDDERGIQQYRVRKLVKLMSSGTALADAVEQVPGILQDDQSLAIRFGVQSGAIAKSIRPLLEDAGSSPSEPRRNLHRNLIYCGVVTFILILATTFIHIKILPALDQIGMDFSVITPTVLVVATGLEHVVITFWWFFTILALAAAWLTFTAIGGRFFRNKIAGKVFWSLSELRSADLLQKLGIAADAGRPIGGALPR